MEEKMMDRKKLMQQAKILRNKKHAQMAKVANQLRPKVENGVVKYEMPQARQIRQLAPPAPKIARPVAPQAQGPTPQQQQDQQQKLNPQKVVRRSKGCSGCRRKR